MRTMRYILTTAVLIVAYFYAARAGLVLRALYAGVSPLWPPAGLALILLWRGNLKWVPVIFIGETLTGLYLHQPLINGLLGGITQTLEAWLALMLIRRLQIAPLLNTPQQAFRFCVLVGLLAPVIPALTGTLALWSTGQIRAPELLVTAGTWWLGDALGIMVLAPAFNAWWRRPVSPKLLLNWLLATLVASVFLLAVTVLFHQKAWLFFFLLLPYVAYSAAVLGIQGATLSLMLMTTLVLTQEARGMTDHFAVALKMGFIGTCALMGYVLAASFHYNRDIRRLLAQERNRFKTTLDSVADSVISVDSEGRVIVMNPQAEAITGVTPADWRHTPFEQLCPLYSDITLSQRLRPVSDFLQSQSSQMECTCYQHSAEQKAVRLLQLQINRLPVEGHAEGAVIVLRDITDENHLREQLAFRAYHDMVTGLPNRLALDQELQRLVDSEDEVLQHALLYVDLDQFKLINDTCGHEVGDLMLKEIAQLLARRAPETAFIARISGDEFVLVLPARDEAAAMETATTIRAAILDYEFHYDDLSFTVGASIGVTFLSRQDQAVSAVLSRADIACYQAKEQGHNRISSYHPDDVEMVRYQNELSWIAQLRLAIDTERFVLFHQGIFAVDNNGRPQQRIGSEILIRMRQDGGIVAPGSFIPIAERFGFMPVIDRWVTEAVLKVMGQGYGGDGVININLSGATFSEQEFFESVYEWTQHYGVHPSRICFEITESVALKNLTHSVGISQELRRRGFHVALDDFGSGSASYAYLNQLPIDYVKLDGQFVRRIMEDPTSRIVVDSLVRIADLENMVCIAECVEDQATMKELAAMGVRLAQGYFYERPCPITAESPQTVT